MSLRNLSNDQHKEWLDAKFNTLNARQFAFTNGDSAVFANTAVLELGGSAGSIGQIVKKNVNNKPAWGTPHVFADFIQQNTDHESTPFTTTSAVLVAGSQFVTPTLAVGKYLFHYQMELQNPSNVNADFFDLTYTLSYNQWAINSGLSDYKTVSGFFVLNVTVPTGRTFQFRCSAPSGGTTSMRRVRMLIYKIS